MSLPSAILKVKHGYFPSDLFDISRILLTFSEVVFYLISNLWLTTQTLWDSVWFSATDDLLPLQAASWQFANDFLLLNEFEDEQVLGHMTYCCVNMQYCVQNNKMYLE